jgi:DNA-binding NtrC family response regulator
MSQSPERQANMLLENVPIAHGSDTSLNDHRAECEARYLQAALTRHKGRISETAADFRHQPEILMGKNA